MTCQCKDRLSDMLLYETHACRDGKRIDPQDLFVQPPEPDDPHVTYSFRVAERKG